MSDQAHGSILLCDQYAHVGGGQTVLLAIAEAALSAGWRETLWFPHGGKMEQLCRERLGPSVGTLDAPEPRLTHGRKTPADVLRFLAYSAGLLRYRHLAAAADVVYVNGSRQTLGMMALSHLTRRPFVYHVHLDHSGLERRLLGMVARSPWTAAVVVNSPFVLRRLIAADAHFGRDPRIVLVENALDRQWSQLPFDNRFADRGGRLSVAVVGALNREKGVDVAVQVAAANPALDLHLIGPVASGSESFVEALRAGAPPNVVFHGYANDVAAKLQSIKAHVLLMPSRCDESFGLAIIEGMAASCIGVVSAAGALPDIAARTGALVCPDEESLARTLGELAASADDSLANLARQQHAATQSAYGADRFAREINAVVEAAAHYRPN